MSVKHNEPKFTDPATMACRGAVEHRATWMALLYEQAKNQGADAEKMCREAIRKCGHIHGDNMYKPQCGDPTSAADFGKVFFSGQGAKNMEIDVISASHDDLVAEFHQCPLVQAWEKLGYEGKELELLCDMAMDGDRGIADQMGLTLDIEKTIAAGDGCCHLHFHK